MMASAKVCSEGGWGAQPCRLDTEQHPLPAEGLGFVSAGPLLNLSVSDHGRSDSLLLSWDAPQGRAEGYLLALFSLGSGTLLQNGSAGPNATSFWFRGLSPGTHYRVELKVTLACMGTASQGLTAQTSKECPGPAVPLPVTITALGPWGAAVCGAREALGEVGPLLASPWLSSGLRAPGAIHSPLWREGPVPGFWAMRLKLEQPMVWAQSGGVGNAMPGGLERAARKQLLLHAFGTSLPITDSPTRPWSLPSLADAKDRGSGQGW